MESAFVSYFLISLPKHPGCIVTTNPFGDLYSLCVVDRLHTFVDVALLIPVLLCVGCNLYVSGIIIPGIMGAILPAVISLLTAECSP